MTDREDGLRILAPRGWTQRYSRRQFLAGSAAAMFSSSVLLAACGEESAPTATGPSGGTELESELNFFNWAAYDDPKLFEKFTEELGPVTSITEYPSNEEAIARLSTAAGTSGYDLVVPTGPFVPLMAEQDLLEPLDLSRIPNFKNIETFYTDQPWDPGNKYTVCKDWGSTGWIIDTEKVKTPIATWQDFIDVAMGEASGDVSLLDAPNELQGLYFWANGIDWNTTDPAQYDAFEDFMVNQLAPHVKAYDSYPGIALTKGNYALSQVWNGDARQGLLDVEARGEDPDRYVWGLGAPDTELWMDTWAIVKGAPNPNAAYAFINFILDVDNSLTDLAYHGYHTGVNGVEQAAEDAGLTYLDLVFFSDEEVQTMHAQVVNEMLDRSVDIYQNAQAASGA